jgi:hypothetical protein
MVNGDTFLVLGWEDTLKRAQRTLAGSLRFQISDLRFQLSTPHLLPALLIFLSPIFLSNRIHSVLSVPSVGHLGMVNGDTFLVLGWEDTLKRAQRTLAGGFSPQVSALRFQISVFSFLPPHLLPASSRRPCWMRHTSPSLPHFSVSNLSVQSHSFRAFRGP